MNTHNCVSKIKTVKDKEIDHKKYRISSQYDTIYICTHELPVDMTLMNQVGQK